MSKNKGKENGKGQNISGIFGLLEGAGIDTTGMTPTEAIKRWGEIKDSGYIAGVGTKEEVKALKKNGVNIQDKIESNLSNEEQRLQEITGEKVENDLEEKKKKRKEQLSKDIDEVLKIKSPKRLRKDFLQMTEDTPKILQQLGLPNLPLYIKRDHVYKCILDDGVLKDDEDRYHGLGKDLFMQIPQLLENPLMIYKDKGVENEVVVVLDKKDKAGWNILVPIRMNHQINSKGAFIKVNRIKSAYGKEEDLQSYLARRTTPERILYKKKEETKENEKQEMKEQKPEQVKETNKKTPTK